MIFKNHDEAMRCHEWLLERGVKESLKVEHRVIKSKVVRLMVEEELWL
jgi:hypothetical protein